MLRALLSFTFGVLLSAGIASAQSFPSRPIKLIVPFPPAGITDLSARLVAEGLRVKFNQPVIVENKPGANGVIGLREMLKAEPDGYTLMMGTVGSVVIGAAMEASPPFDPLRDLVPIAGTAEYATAMVVNKRTPVNSVQEFIAYAKSRPGQLSFGSTGVGALDYLAVELFMQQTGTSMVHVPYRGGPAALNDLMGGSIDLLIEVFPVVMEQARAGLIKALAVSSPYRLPSLPDVPTSRKPAYPASSSRDGWASMDNRGCRRMSARPWATPSSRSFSSAKYRTSFAPSGSSRPGSASRSFPSFTWPRSSVGSRSLSELGLRK